MGHRARLVDVDALPPGRVTVRVDLRGATTGPHRMLLHHPMAEVCTHFAGTAEELVLCTDADALARWHLRECSYAHLIRQQRIRIDGPPDPVRAFPGWICPSPHAVHRTPASAPSPS
ncbi:hypothetical protein LY71_101146 [Geodermatophilus tzadiensis]|uniref:Uncharacterized protein n=1 Tax=Geodermatophilus tzadiensis TaxID=1137988 RepID=A0A2T0U1K7_9ACTN|nr:hypothetical protein [Geodermatophilus tzadiensis]PRY51775.1 hypothetical protein LY71_101146 [Geodermatophilus tzadiensis]